MPDDQPRTMTADDLYRFELITDARLAPDGEQAVFTLDRIDREQEKKYSNLWIVSADGGAAWQFTYGDQLDNSPRWSPDGSRIAFLSNRGDEKQSQIYLIRRAGGEARPLTEVKGSIRQFSWSPDGQKLLLTFTRKDKAALEREEDEQKKKLGVVARHITSTSYKFDGAGFLPEEKPHIWIADAESGEMTQLTPDSMTRGEADGAWSPDGALVAYITNSSPEPDLAPDRDDIYLVPAAGGEPRQIATPLGPKGMPVFSPDGRWLAYLGREGEGQWTRNNALWVVPVDGSAPARNVTGALDWHIEAFSGSDLGGGAMVRPVWSSDGKTLYVQVATRGDVALMAVDVVAAEPAGVRVIEHTGVLGPFTFDADQRRVLYGLSTPTRPSQLFVRDLPAGTERQLTAFNDSWLAQLDLGSREEIAFSSKDGYEIHGWILKPPGFDPSQKYPSILEIHGGPMTQYENALMHEFQTLTAAGYVVYCCNPRGSTGYGEAHCSAILNDWGTVDFDDVMALADFMSEQPYIDRERMGVTGGSYGGYMTNLIIGRSDRFKAAVTQRCVSNLLSMWGSSDANWQFQVMLGNDQPPFANLEQYWRQSPIRTIGDCTTPTLVIHSEQDLRCNLEQGEQVYIALKKLGVDTELILFPDSPHGLSRVGRTDRRIARLNHIRRWFDKYLQN